MVSITKGDISYLVCLPSSVIKRLTRPLIQSGGRAVHHRYLDSWHVRTHILSHDRFGPQLVCGDVSEDLILGTSVQRSVERVKHVGEKKWATHQNRTGVSLITGQAVYYWARETLLTPTRMAKWTKFYKYRLINTQVCHYMIKQYQTLLEVSWLSRQSV